MPLLQSQSIFNLLYTSKIFNYYTNFREHSNLHSTCAPNFQLDLWMAVFFTYTLRLILKKTTAKPGLYHLSRPFYFYINEYNRIVLVAFSFILLPTPSKLSFPPNILYTLVICVVWMPFVEWTIIYFCFTHNTLYYLYLN